MTYAGFWRRFAAYILDSIVVIAVLAILNVATGVIFDCGPPASAGGTVVQVGFSCVTTGIGNIVMLIGSWLYFALMETSSRQGTYGKMVMGIVVTDADGGRLSFGRATGRYFGKIVSALILMIGFIMIAFTSRKQGLHDIMAGCLVTRKPAPTNP